MKEIKFYEDAKVVDLIEEMRNKAEKNLLQNLKQKLEREEV